MQDEIKGIWSCRVLQAIVLGIQIFPSVIDSSKMICHGYSEEQEKAVSEVEIKCSVFQILNWDTYNAGLRLC